MPDKPEKIRVSVEEVLGLDARRREINAIPLDRIEWTRDGAPLDVAPGAIKSWRPTGLSNTCFVELEAYRGGESDASRLTRYMNARQLCEPCLRDRPPEITGISTSPYVNSGRCTACGRETLVVDVVGINWAHEASKGKAT